MPAAVVKGILISIGVIAALGLAVYENPEVQQWLDEQRRKLAQLLRNIGDELDPQSRREAEAFAYGGQEESVGISTARDIPTTPTIRRLPVQGLVDTEAREERQRLGREYLAQRNQQMMEMQQRHRETSRTNSFDSIVDEDGKLKSEDRSIKLEDSEDMIQSEHTSTKEEDAEDKIMDRSTTPRPVVPPKIDLEHLDPSPEPERSVTAHAEPSLSIPGSMPNTDELSYEEQLAIALSLSKEESNPTYAEVRTSEYVEELRRAIEASLQDSAISIPDTEDLYNVTPNLTRASLATFDAQHPVLVPQPIEASFHSAHEHGSKTPTEASSFAFDSETESFSNPLQVDNTSDASGDGIATPDSWTEVGSRDGESDTGHPVTT